MISLAGLLGFSTRVKRAASFYAAMFTTCFGTVNSMYR